MAVAKPMKPKFDIVASSVAIREGVLKKHRDDYAKMIKKITFVRANKIKYGGGGAEVYLSRLSEALTKQRISHSITHSIFPEFLPSWIRVLFI